MARQGTSEINSDKPNETFTEVWERFKDLLGQCLHHGFSELHQLDTFYNALNLNDQDALDSSVGGNYCISKQIDASLEDKLNIRMNRFEKSLNDMKNSFVTPTAPIKAVEEICVTCGANHSYNQCPLTRGKDFLVFHDNIQQFQAAAIGNFIQNINQNGAVYQNHPQQALNYQEPAQQNTVTHSKFEAYTNANDANMNNLQLKFDNFQKNQQDDIIFGFTSRNLCDDFAKTMHDEFEMSMMGELNFFLGLQIKQMEDQTNLAISTTEAEYVFDEKACQQALWMKQALIDYGIRLDNVPIMCDNKGAIDLKLHQLDTFYNALNPNDQDALDSAAGGNILDKIPRECLSIIESKSKVRYSRSRVTDIVASLEDKLEIRMNRFEKSLNVMKNSFITPTAPLKAVAE
nr:copia protein [Tanacetum cinerariifolium]